MGLFGKGWNDVILGVNKSAQVEEAAQIRRDWDSLRGKALTPKERDEIDAIFARYL